MNIRSVLCEDYVFAIWALVVGYMGIRSVLWEL